MRVTIICGLMCCVVCLPDYCDSCDYAAGNACRVTAALRAVLRLKTSLALVLSQHAAFASAAAFASTAVPVVQDCFVMQLPDTQRSILSAPLFGQYPSLLTLLQQWFSASSSSEQRQLVDWPPQWPVTTLIKTKSHPDKYTRVTLKDKLDYVSKTGNPQSISVMHLYDAIREALTSGVLLVSPPDYNLWFDVLCGLPA
jgi:hypothetical protein